MNLGWPRDLIWPVESNGNDSKHKPTELQKKTVYNESITRWTADVSSGIRDPKDKVPKANNCLPRILYPVKLLLKSEKKTETF